MNIYSSQFRQLAGTNFKVKEVYPHYRQAWNNTEKKMEVYTNKDGQRGLRAWDDESRTFTYDNTKQPDYKIHKKVYDIVVETDKPITIENKSGRETGTSFNVRGISASKVGQMAEATVAFGKVPTDENDRKIFDWEEDFIQDLKEQTLVFSVT